MQSIHPVSLEDSVTTELSHSVAAVESADPGESTPVLAGVIDPAALETVVQRSPDLRSGSFEYHGWKLDVQADGTVTIRALAAK